MIGSSLTQANQFCVCMFWGRTVCSWLTQAHQSFSFSVATAQRPPAPQPLWCPGWPSSAQGVLVTCRQPHCLDSTGRGHTCTRAAGLALERVKGTLHSRGETMPCASGRQACGGYWHLAEGLCLMDVSKTHVSQEPLSFLYSPVCQESISARFPAGM